MIKSWNCLHAGLVEDAQKKHPDFNIGPAYFLSDLEFLAGRLIEGDKWAKDDARAELKRLIGRGRCILNAAELAKKDPAGFAAELTRQRGTGAP